MSTARTWQIESTGSDDTSKIALKIGRELRGGEVIELVSDLGGGKTTFVRGLAKGMGSTDTVRSPSFTLGNQYRAGELTLHHFDFYRLTEPGIMRRELAEILEDPHAVIAIEWAGKTKAVLPEEHLSLHIHAHETDPSKRELVFSYPAKFQYLMPEQA